MLGRTASPSRAIGAALICAAAVMTLSACATPPGSAVTASPTTSVEAPVTSTPTPSASVSSAPEPTDDLPEPTPSSAQDASVTIVSTDVDGRTISASGLVTGAAEVDGTCTLTATSASGQVLTGSITAMSTPAAVNCGLIDIQAPAGLWTLVLSYGTGGEAIASDPVTVTQP